MKSRMAIHLEPLSIGPLYGQYQPARRYSLAGNVPRISLPAWRKLSIRVKRLLRRLSIKKSAISTYIDESLTLM
jgi:hypothetical protein